MAITFLKNLITANITQNGSGDTITAAEEREVLNLIADTMSKNVAYSASIPFSSLVTVMADHSVTGLTALTPSSTNAIPGAKTICRFIGDGNIGHVLDLTNFRLSVGAPNTNINTTNSAVTEIIFMYDGTDFFAEINQLYTPAYPLVTTSAATVDATNGDSVILLTTSVPFTNFSGHSNGDEFTVTGHTVVSASGGTGSSNDKISVQVSDAFVAGENRTISYAPVVPAYGDSTGTILAPFSSLAITDSLVAPPALPTFVTSITVEPGAPNTVVLTYNKDVYQYNANFKNSWTVNGVQASSGSISGARVVSLVMPSNFAHGDVITMNCVGSVSAGFSDGSNFNTFSNAPVTNNL